jgi:hypothetical protein
VNDTFIPENSSNSNVDYLKQNPLPAANRAIARDHAAMDLHNHKKLRDQGLLGTDIMSRPEKLLSWLPSEFVDIKKHMDAFEYKEALNILEEAESIIQEFRKGLERALQAKEDEARPYEEDPS